MDFYFFLDLDPFPIRIVYIYYQTKSQNGVHGVIREEEED